LQILSEGDGKHPWYYKPFTCWLQPIKLSDSAIRLYDETTDPNKLPNYDGFVIRTFCGRTEECGQPATEVLKEEIGFSRQASQSRSFGGDSAARKAY
jgi:hypothetical protein